MIDSVFQSQVAIVTGAGVGIGFEVAKQLALQGAKVILNDIDKDLANDSALQIRRQGGICQAFGGDISEISIIEEIIKFTVSSFGKLDILIANAGITTFGDFFDYQPESMQKLLHARSRSPDPRRCHGWRRTPG